MAPDVERVAPLESGGELVAVRGVADIMDNSRRLNAEYQIIGVDIKGPFLDSDQFAVRFSFDQIHTPTGTRSTTTKMSVYTVAAGRITREEVF